MQSLRPRRVKVRLAAVVAVGLSAFLAACSGADPTPGPSGQASQAPLRAVLPAEPATFNPVFSNYSNLRIIGGLFDPLVGFDKKTLEPNDSGLFTKWERVSPTEWKFTLRPDVKFHNGEPWNPAAAIFTLEKYRDETKSGFRPYHTRVVGLRADGADAIVVTTKLPYIALPKVFTNVMGVDPKAYGTDGDAYGRAPVGTGPFRFSELRSGQSFSMVANPDYWKGRPKLAGITYSWAGDPSTRAALLRSGGADLAFDLPAELVREVDDAPGVTVVSAPTLYKMMVSMNTNAQPLSDVRLREAIQAAIDYDGIAKAIFSETGALVNPLFAGDIMGTKPQLAYQKYDPEKAKSLVAQVGGKPHLRYLYTTGFYPKDKQVGEAVSAMLEAAGFEVEQVPLENAELRKERNTGNYAIFSVQNFPVFAHPDSFYAYFSGSAAAVKYCTDPAGYDALQNEALSTDDQARSDELYVEIEKKFMDEDRCSAALYDQVAFYGMIDKVKGFETALDAVPDVYQWSLEA